MCICCFCIVRFFFFFFFLNDECVCTPLHVMVLMMPLSILSVVGCVFGFGWIWKLGVLWYIDVCLIDSLVSSCVDRCSSFVLVWRLKERNGKEKEKEKEMR